MSPKLRASIHRILFATGALTASVVYAEPQQADTNEIAEIVIVTGSYIKGTAEDAALPVDVMTTDDLEKQGSPNMVDVIKSIPAVQGVIGESNQFLVNQGAGTGNINLRGLGATRTLVLLNGRRLAASPTGNGVDTNLLPSAAIGRIEVLKDGAAATYGSDAIAGVVNFITKEDQDGLALDGSYTYIDGSDGDYGANVSYGWSAGASSGLIAAGYRHRSEIDTSERDWAVRSITENPQGGWSLAGNPGTFSTSSGTSVVDPACQTLGGQIVSGTCRFQYIVFDNIVEKEDHYQIFADYNLEIGDTTSFHAEALYAMHDVPEEGVSPSYGANQGPAGGAPNYFIPLANPGLQALLASGALTPAQATALSSSSFGGAQGVIASGLLWRPFAQGGNPITGANQENERKFDGFRLSAGLDGELGSSMNWSTAVTYGENSSEISTPDILVSRLGLALRGLGGPNCTGTTPGANGCEWLNPFSTGIQSHAITGATNNLTYTPGLENSAALAAWLTTPNSYEEQTTLLTVDAVLSGESGINLPGGAMGWAFGTQYRETSTEHTVTDPFANAALTPCAATPVNPNATCNPQNGALSFYGPSNDYDLTQDMYAVFGELSMPITDSFQAQLAVRFEDYGGRVGSTTNPKLSLRWQATDWLAFRGSAGTTFRAPPQTSLTTDASTTLAYTYGAYRAYDTYGNPDLKPEKADTFNVGFILNAGGYNLTVDYWNFKFKDQLTTENAGQIVTAFFGSGAAGQDHCGDPAYAALEERFTFSAAGCGAANLLRTRTQAINADYDVNISGIDMSTSYQFDAGPALMTAGVDGTYNLEYEVGAFEFGGFMLDPADDLIGTRGGRAGTQTEWKANAYLDFSMGMHNVRWTARYMNGVEDVRGGSTFAGLPDSARQIDDFLTHDLVYRVELPAQTIVTFSALNVFDEDPPFTRLDLSYEPFLANPLGRQFKLGASKRF